MAVRYEYDTRKAGILALDLGGTNIKFGLLDPGASLIFCSETPARSRDSEDVLLRRLDSVITACLTEAEKRALPLRGIAVSVPGPFDYDAAQSHMQGKYDAVNGLDLRALWRERLRLPEELPIRFMQDAAAFLAGEAYSGAARDCADCACVTLGTGCGYSCMLNGKLLLNERKGPYYVLAWQTYRGERMEDLVSGRGIERRNGRDAKALGLAAAQGEQAAMRALTEVGVYLGEALPEIPEIAKVEKIVLGGQVAHCFPWIAPAMKERLQAHGIYAEIVQAKYLADAALIGAGVSCFSQR